MAGEKKNAKKIGVIGAGWYGAHIARTLALLGYELFLLDAAAEILSGVSGRFGIRDHAGPHYPRSPKTRESCRRGAAEFDQLYPELIVQQTHSVYALGIKDGSGLPSKVTASEFKAVCEESIGCREIDPKQFGFNKAEMHNAFDVHEPSIAVGKRLRAAWEKYLNEAGVTVKCNYVVNKITKQDGKSVINDDLVFDAIVNATSFQSFLPPKPLPFEIDIKYQVCLALVYEDTKTTGAPFSFIVMDGEFPCLMPYDDRTPDEDDLNRNYIMTHGKWTIMCSKDTPGEAKAVLGNITDQFIEQKVKPRCEKEMARFFPKFSERFKYKGWKGNVLPKVRANTEFRSALTFADEDMIYIIPGKITNVGDTARETLAILEGDNICDEGHYRYVKNGVLDEGLREMKEPITVRNTCDLQTYDELINLSELNEDNVYNAPTSRAPIPTTRIDSLIASAATTMHVRPRALSAPPPPASHLTTDPK